MSDTYRGVSAGQTWKRGQAQVTISEILAPIPSTNHFPGMVARVRVNNTRATMPLFELVRDWTLVTEEQT